MTKLEEAKAFATKAHEGQTYADAHPYTTHLAQVEGVLHRFGVDDETLLVAAWLHDVVEDCHPVTVTQIDRRFGMSVGDLVWAVTNAEGKNRAERHEKTYPKIRAVGGKAVVLKLADRIANVEQSVADAKRGSHGKLKMYQKEHEGFCLGLIASSPRSDTERRMWDWLSQLLKGG